MSRSYGCEAIEGYPGMDGPCRVSAGGSLTRWHGLCQSLGETFTSVGRRSVVDHYESVMDEDAINRRSLVARVAFAEGVDRLRPRSMHCAMVSGVVDAAPGGDGQHLQPPGALRPRYSEGSARCAPATRAAVEQRIDRAAEIARQQLGCWGKCVTTLDSGRVAV